MYLRFLLSSLILSFFVAVHCECGGFLLHLIPVTDSYTLGRTLLDEGSARRRGLFLRNTDIHAPVGFEPVIPASEWPQTRALDPTAAGIGRYKSFGHKRK
jgi:hypothetical protein